MNTENKKLKLPLEGLAGLKENFSTDAISGFIVFLLAANSRPCCCDAAQQVCPTYTRHP